MRPIDTVWLKDDDRKKKIADDLNPEAPGNFGFIEIPKEEKEDWVRNHFRTVAESYDFMNTLLSFGIHYLWKRDSVNWLGLRPGERVLDVCGGTGDLSVLARRKVGKTGEVVLYDINWDMITVGRRKREEKKTPLPVACIQGDAEFLSFPDASFDAAMVGFGIRNLTRMRQGFQEMHRVLKPGGRMICLEFSKPHAPFFRWLYDFYSFYIMPVVGEVIGGSRQAYTYLPESIRLFPMPDELSDILREIGFSRVRYRRLTNGIAVVHLAEKGD